jgi:hypothetical protein
MRKSLGRLLVFQALLVLLAGVAACNKSKTSEQVNQGGANAGGPPPGMPAGPPMGGPGRPHGPIGEAMTKLAKGPQSLNALIGNELKGESPPWDTLQPQAKEYAQLTASLSKYDPPKGDKASWTKQADAFAQTAGELEHAADAKDKSAALAAHQKLQMSCKACHDAHRGGPGGRGMPPGGFRGPGGPPRPPQ